MARNEFDEPDAPEKPTVKDWGEDFVDLAWKPPLNDGGSPITDYIIQKKEKGNPYWMNALEVPANKTDVSLLKVPTKKGLLLPVNCCTVHKNPENSLYYGHHQQGNNLVMVQKPIIFIIYCYFFPNCRSRFPT